ncbi:hypothetical protein G6N05_15430 [Flavobacterium sp. F372]|uniref:DUF4199 domain-containing protein n=1 Tax=Flavobacterium bernardetii TaxID=2813823 RepID=A0ABR7J2P5_9FLAO|nr:hypothetical protein [Flavobacterium bernardetii]MBC5836257.1 hypothetical protein [Flavobacterium bernardetii]NHF71502.1 hypothetical protein [Flavobacterium bernardetii]
MNNKKYTFETSKTVLFWTIIPNIFLFIFWKFDETFSFAPTLTIFFNSIILPIALIISVKNINEKYNKNWWYLNYVIFTLSVLLSIFFNLFNWILSVEKENGFYGRNNIDKGTWMIINLELMIGFGILCIGLIYDIIKSVPKSNINLENEK